MLKLPRAGFVARMRTYLSEMFPLPLRLLTASLLYTSFATLLAKVHGLGEPILSLHMLRGSASVFALMLMLRLMDELKDAEVDRTLFPGRPLPSGRVGGADIAFTLAVVVAVFLPLHAGATLGTAATVLAYALLMFRWFFIPARMRPSLPLALATHTLIVPLQLLNLLALFAAEHGLAPDDVRWRPSLLLVVMYWAMVFAWEIARKVRSRQEENAYVTYSQIFGPVRAVLVAGGAQALAFAAGLHLYHAYAFSSAFLGALTAGFAGALAAHGRFLLASGPRTSRLGPYAEANVLAALLAGFLA